MKNQLKIERKVNEARSLEMAGDLPGAEKLYLKLLKAYPAAFAAYDRLMIIYRKLAAIAKELAIIRRAINTFKADALEKQQDWIKKNQAAAGLTRDLAIGLGLLNKDGSPSVNDPLLIKWQKREELLLKREEKKKTKPKAASKTPKSPAAKKKSGSTTKKR